MKMEKNEKGTDHSDSIPGVGRGGRPPQRPPLDPCLVILFKDKNSYVYKRQPFPETKNITYKRKIKGDNPWTAAPRARHATLDVANKHNFVSDAHFSERIS